MALAMGIRAPLGTCSSFSSIMLTLFTETSPLRMSATLRKHMWATMDQRYVRF